MNADTYKDIEKLEADLWEAADNLRANSKLTSSDYFMPVLGVIFLRHAANRFDAAHRQIEADQASGKMPKRKVLPADYIARRSLYLPEKARYDYIMQQAATSGADLPKLVTEAMTAIEAEFEPLLGVLPKHYGTFENKVLEDLVRLFNSEQIKQATSDVLASPCPRPNRRSALDNPAHYGAMMPTKYGCSRPGGATPPRWNPRLHPIRRTE